MKSRHTIDSAETLEAAYHALIPISEAMGISVAEVAADRLVLDVLLANNLNHQQSAFGGSLFSAAALAGWGLLQLKLAPLGGETNTVLASSDVSFKAPVFADFQCVCELPEAWDAFEDTLVDAGRASLILTPRIEVDGGIAMRMTGRYVVTR